MPPSPPGNLNQKVCAWIIRDLFNEQPFPDRIGGTRRVGADLVSMREMDRGSPDAAANQPAGTDSVMVEFITSTGRQVAVAHFYQLANGTIVGRGADPKLLRWRQWKLRPFRSKPAACVGCTATHN